MDESVERKLWLDKLLTFMEDRGSPICATPTISKNPLDLFRLYLYVKERGGFVEVCKVTKNKVWKDIAGLLGIGASSSAAYTLRKHYTKNLLPFECHYDRGGIDPQPIINQVEANSKKKGSKTAPVPSPGSSNSQDSFQGGGMDGGAYPGYNYPQEYNSQRPPSQTNPGVQQGYPGQQYGGQYGDQYVQGYGGYPGRPLYPGYESDRPPASYPDGYRGYPYGGGAAGAAPARGYPTGSGAPSPGAGGQPTTPPAAASSPAPQTAAPTPPAPQSDYYRSAGAPPDQYPYGGKTMPPPQPGPRRHPDFVKDQAQPPPGQQPPYPPYSPSTHRPPPPPNMYPGWSNNSGGQYRGGYPGGGTGGGAASPGQWAGGAGAPGPATPAVRPPAGGAGQWPAPSTGAYQPGAWPPPNRPPRPPAPSQHPYRPDLPPSQLNPKQFPPMPPPSIKGGMPGTGMVGTGGGLKREVMFPAETVEGTTPVLYKRRRLTRSDVAPVEAWRLMMSLKSGLLAETTWALDVLNVLLFDDHSVAYFGLLHLPGLLDILLEHMNKFLGEMLDEGVGRPAETDVDVDVDVGAVTCPPDPTQRVCVVARGPDLTMRSRRGLPVIHTPAHQDVFVTDGRRSWDTDDPRGDDPDLSDHSRYIVPCFRSEVSDIPFYRRIAGEAPPSPRPPPDPHDPVCIKTEPTLNGDTPDIKEELIPIKEEPDCKIRDPAGILKRRRISDYEDECYSKDEASLYLVTESQDSIARRCICISTILRNLTFVPGNDTEFAKSGTFLALVGRLLLLHHEHPPRPFKQLNYEWEEGSDDVDSCLSLQAEHEWWWEFLTHLRENALVSLANICGQVDLGVYPEDVSRPILDGLLHWAVCPAAQGQDPFPTVGPSSSLSPQRLALEALCKLCVTDSNVDLVIATPPYCRLERLTTVLTKLLCRSEEQVLREFGVNLLYYLGAADSGMARTIALQPACVSLLVGFIEQAESGAMSALNSGGVSALRDNPDSAMGTSVDMVRRCARALLALARHPANRPLLAHHEHRLLQLAMSQVLDQPAAATLARVLFQLSRPPPAAQPCS